MVWNEVQPNQIAFNDTSPYIDIKLLLKSVWMRIIFVSNVARWQLKMYLPGEVILVS